MQLVRGRAWGAFWYAVVGAVVAHVIHWRRRAAERQAGEALATPSGFVAQVYGTVVLIREIVARLQDGRILKSAEYCPSPAQWAEELEHVRERARAYFGVHEWLYRTCVRVRACACVFSGRKPEVELRLRFLSCTISSILPSALSTL